MKLGKLLAPVMQQLSKPVPVDNNPRTEIVPTKTSLRNMPKIPVNRQTKKFNRHR